MKKAILGILTSALLFTGCSDSSVFTKSSQDIMEDRLWIDSIPERPTDLTGVFVAIDEEVDPHGKNIGLVASVSHYRDHRDLFFWTPVNDSKMEMLYPQTGETNLVSYTAEECDVDYFELCLTLFINGQTHTYYSLWDWDDLSPNDVNNLNLEKIKSDLN